LSEIEFIPPGIIEVFGNNENAKSRMWQAWRSARPYKHMDIVTFQFRGIISPSCHFNLDEHVICQLWNRHEVQLLPKNLAQRYNLFSALPRAQVGVTYQWFKKIANIGSKPTKPIERFLDLRVIQQSLLISLLLGYRND